jgi:hypothetical protein
MTDLEDRLRDALRDLAGAVPQSPDARADLERRITQRRKGHGRTTMLAAAAAALVLVAVALPAVFSSGDDPRQGLMSTPPSTDTSSPPSTNGMGSATPDSSSGYIFAGPIELGAFDEDGVTRTAFMQVEQVNAGERMCVMVRPGTGSRVGGTGCVVVPVWPTAPDDTGYVATHGVLSAAGPDTGPLPDLILFMTAPQVTTLEVRRGDGGAVKSTMLAVSPRAKFYLGDFDGATAGFGYTAKDMTGKVLETAIT